MPGKVNPVIPEVVNQIAFRVIGYDATVTLAVEGGQLELNAFEPVIFDSLYQGMTMLRGGVHTLIEHCLARPPGERRNLPSGGGALRGRCDGTVPADRVQRGLLSRPGSAQDEVLRPRACPQQRPTDSAGAQCPA